MNLTLSFPSVQNVHTSSALCTFMAEKMRLSAAPYQGCLGLVHMPVYRHAVVKFAVIYNGGFVQRELSCSQHFYSNHNTLCDSRNWEMTAERKIPGPFAPLSFLDFKITFILKKLRMQVCETYLSTFYTTRATGCSGS